MEGGLNLAKSIYNALHYGYATAWIYWQMSESYDKGFIKNGEPNWLYYASKQFYKHIRLESIRVKISESEDNLLALAFLLNGKKTILLINIGEEDLELNFEEKRGQISFIGYLTNKTNKHEILKDINISKPVVIEGKSILTLVQQ